MKRSLMGITPFEKWNWETELTIEEILSRLKSNLEEDRLFRFDFWGDKQYKLFEGKIIGDKFEIRRVIRGRNSFRALIFGNVEDMGSYRKISVQIRMHYFVYVFMLFWLGVVGIAAIGITIQALHLKKFEPSSLIVYGMFAFGALLTIIGFKYDSVQSVEHLQNIFGVSSQGGRDK